MEQIKKFQRGWYGLIPKQFVRTRGSALSLQELGIGREVPLEQAQPGDFVNFSRLKSGHSVIFLEWMKRQGSIIGIRYRSSQRITNGIGDRTEYFSSSGIGDGMIDYDSIVVSRLNAS